MISEQTIQVEVNGPNPSVRRDGDSLHVESATAWDGQRDVRPGGSMQGLFVRVDGRGGESDNRVAGLACNPQIAAGITRQVGGVWTCGRSLSVICGRSTNCPRVGDPVTVDPS